MAPSKSKIESAPLHFFQEKSTNKTVNISEPISFCQKFKLAVFL